VVKFTEGGGGEGKVLKRYEEGRVPLGRKDDKWKRNSTKIKNDGFSLKRAEYRRREYRNKGRGRAKGEKNISHL